MTPLIHQVEHIANIHTDAASQTLVEVDVRAEAVPVAIEGKTFYQSVLNYMRSADFNPSAEITVDELKKKLAEKPRQVSLKELNNISQY